MATNIEITSAEEIADYKFKDDIEVLLGIIQEMTANKGEITKGEVIEFFTNLSVNLVVNSKVCHACYMGNLEDTFTVAMNSGLVESHEINPELH